MTAFHRLRAECRAAGLLVPTIRSSFAGGLALYLIVLCWCAALGMVWGSVAP